MTILLNKLEKLLNSNNFIIESLFIQGNLCTHMRVISIVSGIMFIVCIDESYRFRVTDEFQGRSFFKMSVIDLMVGDDIIEKYSEYPDDKQVKEKYANDPVSINEVDGTSIEDTLESKYVYRISLKDITKTETKLIKDCFRQLKRLSLCTQNLRYKMCIIRADYISITGNDDLINCYRINDFKQDDTICVHIAVDLEYFYKKITHVVDDITTIKKSLYGILNRTHDSCIQTITKLVKDVVSSIHTSDQIQKKKDDIDSLISKCEQLMESVTKHEIEYNQKYMELNNDKSSEDVYVHQKKRITDKLTETKNIKKKILTSLIQLRTKKDNIYFMVDNIEFDNTVMLDNIIERIKQLNVIKL